MKQFADTLTDLVYFSRFFALRFPVIFETCRANLEAGGIEVRTIGGNQNIWIRDWAPAQVGDCLVKFGYKGYSKDGLSAGYEDYPWLIIPDKCITGLNTFKPLNNSTLVLDGGGVVRSKSTAVITEKVFLDNPTINQLEILAKLQEIFNLDVIIIPMEPGDTLGHSDGICKYVDETTLLVNDYSCMQSKEFDKYQEEILSRFHKAGLTTVLMPYVYDRCPQMTEDIFRARFPFSDDFNAAYGYYINFLLTKSVILAPVFGIEKDKEAITTLKMMYPNHSVVAVNCAELSMEGGLLSCVTSNYIK
jgi:agmatine deiminase